MLCSKSSKEFKTKTKTQRSASATVWVLHQTVHVCKFVMMYTDVIFNYLVYECGFEMQCMASSVGVWSPAIAILI